MGCVGQACGGVCAVAAAVHGIATTIPKIKVCDSLATRSSPFRLRRGHRQPSSWRRAVRSSVNRHCKLRHLVVLLPAEAGRAGNDRAHQRVRLPQRRETAGAESRWLGLIAIFSEGSAPCGFLYAHRCADWHVSFCQNKKYFRQPLKSNSEKRRYVARARRRSRAGWRVSVFERGLRERDLVLGLPFGHCLWFCGYF